MTIQSPMGSSRSLTTSSRPNRRVGAPASLSLTSQPKPTIRVEEGKAPPSDLHFRSINAMELASKKVPGTANIHPLSEIRRGIFISIQQFAAVEPPPPTTPIQRYLMQNLRPNTPQFAQTERTGAVHYIQITCANSSGSFMTGLLRGPSTPKTLAVIQDKFPILLTDPDQLAPVRRRQQIRMKRSSSTTAPKKHRTTGRILIMINSLTEKVATNGIIPPYQYDDNPLS